MSKVHLQDPVLVSEILLRRPDLKDEVEFLDRSGGLVQMAQYLDLEFPLSNGRSWLQQPVGDTVRLLRKEYPMESPYWDKDERKAVGVAAQIGREATASVGPNLSEAEVRKTYPLATGVLDYFPDALMEVAHLSKVGNDQHNPGQPLHWAKGKSTDHADALLRHLKDRGRRDTDGERHSAKVAWRALANLQMEIEQERDDARKADRERGKIDPYYEH